MMTWMWMGLVLTALASTLGYSFVCWQLRAQNKRIAILHEQLAAFTEASINVARCVDRQVIAGQVDGQRISSVPSRRWLLHEVKQRIQGGADLSAVARDFRLSRDEVNLLQTYAA